MLLEDFSKRKEDYKMKKLTYFSNIFNKKLKYDTEIKLNKSESKNIIKQIKEIVDKNQMTFKHYYKVEKELIEYIAELNVKNYANEGYLSEELKKINKSNLKMMDILKKKRIKIIQEKRKELEQTLDNYLLEETKRRDGIIYDRLERDLLVFKKLDEAKKEMKEMAPTFRILEKDIEKYTLINDDLKRKYQYKKIENEILLSLLDKLHQKNKKIIKNNGIIIDNKKYMNKSLILKSNNKINSKNKNNISSFTSRKKCNKNNSFRLNRNSSSKSYNNPLTTRYSSKNVNKQESNKNFSEIKINKNLFVPKKNSISNQIFKKCLDNKIKIRDHSARTIFINENENSINNNKYNEINNDKNKYIIESLKELNKNIKKKLEEKILLFSKELDFQNIVGSLICQCVEDLNIKCKKMKSEMVQIQKLQEKEKEKDIKMEVKDIIDINKENELSNNIENIEQKIFIFSYIYDNCLKNGEFKELKRKYSMFPTKK